MACILKNILNFHPSTPSQKPAVTPPSTRLLFNFRDLEDPFRPPSTIPSGPQSSDPIPVDLVLPAYLTPPIRSIAPPVASTLSCAPFSQSRNTPPQLTGSSVPLPTSAANYRIPRQKNLEQAYKAIRLINKRLEAAANNDRRVHQISFDQQARIACTITRRGRC
eukprot:IDg11243t1